MPYYEVTYAQKSGSIALDGLLDEHGAALTTQNQFTFLSQPTTVGAGDVIDALGEFTEGVMILSIASPPAVGSDLVTTNWVATVKAVELITLGTATPLNSSYPPPPLFFEVSPLTGTEFGTSPVRIFNQAWADDNLITWRNDRTYAIPARIYPRNVYITFESSPDTSYTTSGLATRTADGTAHTSNYYIRMLRNLTTSIYPGVLIPYTFNNNIRYEMKIWARVPTTAVATQILYVRHNLTTFGTNYWNAQQIAVPRDNTWREYTFNFTVMVAQGIDSSSSTAWWIQHAGAQDDANAFLDIDDVSITYLGTV